MNFTDGSYMKLTYDHLPSMQEDVGQMYATEKTKLEILNKSLTDKVISIQEYRENLPDFIELDPSNDFSQDTSEVDKLLFESSLKLRGTVGGVDGIIGINQAVADGQMTRDNAINLLTVIYQFEEQIADSLITTVTNTGNGEEQQAENGDAEQEAGEFQEEEETEN